MTLDESKAAKKEVATRKAPKPGHLPMTELLFVRQGPPSPFGEDMRFPLPLDQVEYEHASLPDA
ncbi:hypothetical protein [Fodinicola acaciae]|uniref:hypothetical protein n=1 Tax=Fodinicola acaciae TaxID=2681555 RepID=UPI0013D29CB7|nr:hypothetical protein [Fodinicola acaciae]